MALTLNLQQPVDLDAVASGNLQIEGKLLHKHKEPLSLPLLAQEVAETEALMLMILPSCDVSLPLPSTSDFSLCFPWFIRLGLKMGPTLWI